MEQMSLNLPGVSAASPGGRRARTARLRVSAGEWPRAAGQGQALSSSLRDFFVNSNLATSSSRMSLACLPQTRDGISPTSSWRWPTAGILSHGECWTLSMCEWTGCPAQFPSGGAGFGSSVCGLSDILETVGEHLRKYCLSLKACAGILRRAASRGKDLPARLAAALKAQIARFQRTATAGT